MSIAVADRLGFMEALAPSLPRNQVMIGTGASALRDAIKLTSRAFSLGFAAALVIPPFYYRDVPDSGILRYFDALLSAVNPPPRGILLYNFPRMSGITFHTGLVEQLIERYPGIIGGMKDSSNTLELERDLHTRYPDLAILPGSEELLPEVLDDEFAGCISGSVCLWVELAADAWKNRNRPQAEEVARLRRQVTPPIIVSVREAVARQTGSQAWLRSVPPLSG